MTTKYEIVSVNNVDVMVDVSMLLKNEDLFFNATDMAKKFSKKTADFLRLQSTKDYVDEIINESENLNYDDLVKTINGGRKQGTWLHKRLMFKFAEWLGGEKISQKIHKQSEDYQSILQALESFEIPEDLPDMYVYAIRESDTRNIKIGISKDPESRLKQLQTGNSQNLELVAYRKAENRYKDEASTHELASKYHIHGEWFDKHINLSLLPSYNDIHIEEDCNCQCKECSEYSTALDCVDDKMSAFQAVKSIHNKTNFSLKRTHELVDMMVDTGFISG